MATISTPKFGDLTFKDMKGGTQGPVQVFRDKPTGQATGLQLTLSGKPYTFIPQNIVEKGWVQDGKQYYLGNLLDEYNSKMLLEQGEVINLSGIGNYDQFAADNNISTTGFLLPFRDASRTQLVTKNIRNYTPDETARHGEITGLSFINDKPVYLTGIKGKPEEGGKVTQSWIQAPGTVDYTGAGDDTGEFFYSWYKEDKPGGLLGFVNDIVSSDLFKIAALAYGAYGLYNLAAAPAAAAGGAGAGAGAAGASLAPGSFQAALPGLGIETAATAAGATAVPGSFAAALPSLITPVNVLGDTAQGLLNQDLEFVAADAEQLWKTTGDVGAVQQNLIAAGVDPIMAAEASNLAALGGTTQSISSALGQAFPGETVFTSEGLLSGGATMDEFAKDIGGNITSSAATGLGVQDALRMAHTGMQLFGGQQQQGILGGGTAPYQAQGVDYSGLLSILQGQARTPGVSPLIAPVVSPVASPYEPLLGQQPQYQSLLGRTQQSLLG